MKITAKFIGEDGSLGYHHNKVYTLSTMMYKSKTVVFRHSDRKGVCEYSNLKAFLDNWANISSL